MSSIETPGYAEIQSMIKSRTTTKTLQSTILCQECRRPWVDQTERWRMYVTEDAQAELVPYCADCAHREFDPD